MLRFKSATQLNPRPRDWWGLCLEECCQHRFSFRHQLPRCDSIHSANSESDRHPDCRALRLWWSESLNRTKRFRPSWRLALPTQEVEAYPRQGAEQVQKSKKRGQETGGTQCARTGDERCQHLIRPKRLEGRSVTPHPWSYLRFGNRKTHRSKNNHVQLKPGPQITSIGLTGMTLILTPYLKLIIHQYAIEFYSINIIIFHEIIKQVRIQPGPQIPGFQIYHHSWQPPRNQPSPLHPQKQNWIISIPSQKFNVRHHSPHLGFWSLNKDLHFWRYAKYLQF